MRKVTQTIRVASICIHDPCTSVPWKNSEPKNVKVRPVAEFFKTNCFPVDSCITPAMLVGALSDNQS